MRASERFVGVSEATQLYSMSCALCGDGADDRTFPLEAASVPSSAAVSSGSSSTGSSSSSTGSGAGGSGACAAAAAGAGAGAGTAVDSSATALAGTVSDSRHCCFSIHGKCGSPDTIPRYARGVSALTRWCRLFVTDAAWLLAVGDPDEIDAALAAGSSRGGAASFTSLSTGQEPGVVQAVLPSALQADVFRRAHDFGMAHRSRAGAGAGDDDDDDDDDDDVDYYAGVRVCEDVVDRGGVDDDEGEDGDGAGFGVAASATATADSDVDAGANDSD